MKKKYSYLLLSFLLFACSSESESSDRSETDKANFEEEVVEMDEVIEVTEIEENPEVLLQESMLENGTLVHLDGLSFGIDTLDVWNQGGEKEFRLEGYDTVQIYLGLAWGIGDRDLHLFYEHIENLKIYQSYETSITIMNEGPHCDLTEWKHYKSKWSLLKLGDKMVRTNAYEEKDYEKFIEVDMNELAEAAREHCGDFWAEHVSESTSPTDYPSGVTISRTFLKFEYNFVDDPATVVNYVCFNHPMGC